MVAINALHIDVVLMIVLADCSGFACEGKQCKFQEKMNK